MANEYEDILPVSGLYSCSSIGRSVISSLLVKLLRIRLVKRSALMLE